MKYIKFLSFFTFLIFSINVKAQWVPASGGIPNLTVTSLVSNGNVIYCCGPFIYIYKTTNAGLNWNSTSLVGNYTDKLASSNNYVYALQNNKIYSSSDAGATWILIRPFINYLKGCLTASNNVVLAGEWQECSILSTDSGLNWNYRCPPDIGTLGSDGSNFFAGNGSVIYFSTNNGSTFTPSNLGPYANCFAANGNNVFAGKNAMGVYHSTDFGATYVQTTLNNLDVISLVVTGSNVFAGTDSSGVHLSTNNGTSWTQINQGMGNLRVNTLLINGNYVYAGTTNYSVWKRLLSEVLSVPQISSEVPEKYSLLQNYPNPFNPSTNIKFNIPAVGNAYMRSVQLKIYDALGKEIAVLVNEQLKPGSYEVTWDASNYPSGVYFYKLVGDNNNGEFIKTKKMVLLK